MPTPRRIPPAAVLAVFFVSGVAALLYQIVWLKYLGFVFGNTVYAAATLIAIFLAGLGLGGYLFGRFFAHRPPLALYAILEALIGTIGAFSPNGFGLLDHGYVASFRAFENAPLLLAMARAFFAALFLLPPTILMGATLPVLVRWYTRDLRGSGKPVSSLYAVNTFGAAAGVALAGFYLIPRVGLLATIFVAVAMNYLLGVVAAVASFASGGVGTRGSASSTLVGSPKVQDALSRVPTWDSRLILVASFLMGLTSIADEVFWSRILVLHLGSSVYAYSLMLFSFLIGIAVGSALIYLVIDRVDLPLSLGLLEVGLALLLALQIHYFTQFADVMEWFAGAIRASTYGGTLVALLGATLSALLLPTAIMGATFPVAVKLYSRSTARGESRSVGVIYLVNTLGSISGSLLAGFVLIRVAGSQNGLFLMAALNLAVGAYFLSRAPVRATVRHATAGIATAALVAAFVVARPDQVILSAGMFVDSRAPVLLFREDVTATVTLRKLGPDYLSLELNGVNVAGTSSDLIGTQKLQGHLPLLMHPNPRSVLHIGFGSGGTAHAVSVHPVEQIRIAEISPEVLEASHQYLRGVNHGVLEDPRVRVEINDGRNFVLATPETFDVILSDSIHPRYAGNGSLYTRDYFELCRRRLNPGGVVSMWLPTYSLTPRNYLMILKAFREVFPNTTVWYIPNTLNAFTIVIGRTEPGPIAMDRIESKMTSAVLAELSDIGIASPYDLAGALLLDPVGVAELTRGIEAHVDDVPAVEYESGRILDRERSWLVNFVMLAGHMTPLPRAFGRPIDSARLVRAEEIRHQRATRHIAQLAAALQQNQPPAKI